MNKQAPKGSNNKNGGQKGESKNSSNKPKPTISRSGTKPPPSPKKGK
ncbi:hypothetical protein [Salegentibacter maritimus]|uniref:Uncharacterized protein n=1 Tax=Salegentibacter maritimus TaxID=2794347 RepID=A0ABS0TJZ5_9FLAO|nr:hypothetical protein [Salegentibacter maritimus]MBI6121356.1 hypothetical protein [Salegentibacter maritimus]